MPASARSSGQASQDNPFATTAPPPARQGWGCLGCLGQLIALGVVSGGAIAVGVAVAQIYPRPGSGPPLVVQGWQRAQGAIAQVLPGSQSWLGEGPPPTDLADIDFVPAPDVPTADRPAPATPASPALAPAQREALRLQLQDLQTQLNQLIGETATLEQQLGDRASPDAPLEQRLEAIAQQLTAASSPSSETPTTEDTPTETPPAEAQAPENQPSEAQPSEAQPSETQPSETQPSENQDPETQTAENQPAENQTAATPDTPNPGPSATASITLPSDALFRDTYATLRPEAASILDNVLAELETEGGATIRISVHTDSVGDAQDNRELSLRRAGAIAQYLSTALPEGYRWVIAGFGESRPIAPGEDDTSLQRNRRIELQIDPR